MALFGALPGTITAIRGPAGGLLPAYAAPAPRAVGVGMFGLLAVGVVVWMLARGGDRD